MILMEAPLACSKSAQRSAIALLSLVDILRLLVQYATFNMCDLMLLGCVNAKRTKEGREEKIVHSTDEILT